LRRICKRNIDLDPGFDCHPRLFVTHKIATTVCYRCVMLTLIFALAVRLVARVAGAVAARLSHFPAVSLPGPAAGKNFSLPVRSGKLAQRFDVTTEFRSNREDFGAKSKIFPAVSLLAGKIALATGNTNAQTIMIGEKGAAMTREDASR
jgi:hypothetical protein